MKGESSCAFLPSDRFHPTDLLAFCIPKFWKKNSWLILELNANESTIVEFIQEYVFVRLKPFAEIESKFDVWFWKMYFLSIPSGR